MKTKTFLIILCCLATFYAKTQNLSKQQITEDLDFLDQTLQKHSSYQGLNGFEYQPAFETYLQSIKTDSVSLTSFGLFLTRTIGKIGDRHSSIRGYDLPNSLYLPFSVAPLEDKVVGVTYHRADKTHQILYPNFPYLTKINGINIDEFLSLLLPEEIKAPKAAYFTRAVKRLKYMEKNYAMMEKELPVMFEFTFSDTLQNDTLIRSSLDKTRKYKTWGDYFLRDFPEEDELNDPNIAQQLFQLDDEKIAYIRMTDMVKPEEAPNYYKAFHQFMNRIKVNSQALIIDVRANGGGSRHLTFELAKYVVHPDSIYVVNVAKQKCTLPINDDLTGSLNYRFLYAMEDLDKKEQRAVHAFMKSFKPMYDLAKDQFSEYHYALFNGEKLSKTYYHYNKPIYILMNERSFSAASIFAALFKGLPHVKLVGVTTDGSSGNSEKVRLPHSKIKAKISTMVSFQKDGKILDGYGTEPDITLKRTWNHIFWKEDSQLEQLKRMIISN